MNPDSSIHTGIDYYKLLISMIFITYLQLEILIIIAKLALIVVIPTNKFIANKNK
jgi:hypothetical protein